MGTWEGGDVLFPTCSSVLEWESTSSSSSFEGFPVEVSALRRVLVHEGLAHSGFNSGVFSMQVKRKVGILLFELELN